MNLSRGALSLVMTAALLGGAAGCIDRTTGGGPYSNALARLRQLGVPSRFDDGLLQSLSSLACDMPAGTRATEFEPGAFRLLAAAGAEIDAGAGALVVLLFSNGASLCLQLSPSGTPNPSGTSSTTTYADFERDLVASLSDVLQALDEQLSTLGLTNARVSVPAKGIMRIEGDAPPEVAAKQLACSVAVLLAVDFVSLLTPLERAIQTGDPDPIVQIALNGADPILDSSPNGLIAFAPQCFGA